MSHLGSKDFKDREQVLQGQADRIQKGLYGGILSKEESVDYRNLQGVDDIIKGGEGSKGGKVIGHTKSGKAIYDSSHSKEHKNFSAKDHEEAALFHKEAEKKSSFEAKSYHKQQENNHAKLAKQKESSKHISDMTKEEKHEQAEKMGIKDHKEMSEKDLDKHLTDKNVEKEVEKFKEKKEELSEDEINSLFGSDEYEKEIEAMKKKYGGDDEDYHEDVMDKLVQEAKKKKNIKKSEDDDLQKAYQELGI